MEFQDSAPVRSIKILELFLQFDAVFLFATVYYTKITTIVRKHKLVIYSTGSSSKMRKLYGLLLWNIIKVNFLLIFPL